MVTHDPLPVVHGEKVQLMRLLENLLGNALKYCTPGTPPRIHVSAERVNDSWRFVIQDNGIGIKSADRKRIFEVFQRLHDRGKYEGTGIGLALCKKIVERHGGEIWVGPDRDSGTSFYFTLSEQA
ncbi:ATP-binding protein [Magnetospira sp. QH-2]|uniref:sensor histidine kinase n=1 Tax=Magnetospira sp. (strain QH-2) TaxID=1288970 RepID=UPI00069892FF|nr:ATP-binding protein [Magnetospira sp. QH-2]